MPHNQTINISPSQALLLLIEDYRQHNPQSKRLNSLKRELLQGYTNKRDSQAIKELTKNISQHSTYTICTDPETINEDPVRRYFETRLCHETVKNNIAHIDQDQLESYIMFLHEAYAAYCHSNDSVIEVNMGLAGSYHHTDETLIQEYGYAINQIHNGYMFNDFDQNNRNKLICLMQSSMLAVLVAQTFPYLPINIYGKGWYHKTARGKNPKPHNQSTHNQHLGLMKGHMPLPVSDPAYHHEAFPYLKPSDQSTYDINALWPKHNFEQLMHPYSNSLSGTLLCHLRCLAFLRIFNAGLFDQSLETFELFSKTLIASLLTYSGGHSLNEYVTPFSLPEVRKEFKDVFTDKQRPNMISLFMTSNEASFENALKATLAYNHQLLKKNHVLSELTHNLPPNLDQQNPKNNVNLTLLKIELIKRQINDYYQAYRHYVDNQYFSLFRQGKRKRKWLQQGLDTLQKYIEQEYLQEAKQQAQHLQTQTAELFGTTTRNGRTSQLHQTIQSICHELETIQSELHPRHPDEHIATASQKYGPKQ